MTDKFDRNGERKPHEDLSLKIDKGRRGPTWIAFLSLLILGLLGWPLLTEQLWSSIQGRAAGTEANLPSATIAALKVTPTLTVSSASEIPTVTDISPLGEIVSNFTESGAILSITEAGYSHLFYYSLQDLSSLRLTSGDWDDIGPALSPNGELVAFVSDRNGQWDLYVLDLISGETVQVSNDPAYDGSPTWAPDGSWLAYDHYTDDGLDIFIRPLDASVEPVRITSHPGIDQSPAWSPVGQQIAFISDREGSDQLWLVDLEAISENRFQQISISGQSKDPVWSPDGRYLAWSSLQGGLWRVTVLDFNNANIREIGQGEQIAWSSDGQTLLAIVRPPDESYLSAYTLDGGLALAPLPLSGQVRGIAWGALGMPLDELPEPLLRAAQSGARLSWLESSQGVSNSSFERQELVALNDLVAPYPEMNTLAVPSFMALREHAALSLGWDVLSNLENVYTPLSVPLSPGRTSDWLYTGRAFELNNGLLRAGWLKVVKEEHGGETYWRLYLKVAAQNGSLGSPIKDRVWDFEARFSGENGDYQAGGRLANHVPGGYWLDFTALAADYGWERLPAMNNWRSYFQGNLFGEFAFRQGLSWEEAMLQIYPIEAISTPIAPGSE